mgnify:CR=1 FL=1
MDEDVLIALITALGGVVIALIGGIHLIRQKRQDKHVNTTLGAVKEQVTNEHDSNLRHDIDDVTTLVGSAMVLLETVNKTVLSLHTTVNNMDQRIIESDKRTMNVSAQLTDHLAWSREQEDRIDALAQHNSTERLPI